MPTYLPHIKPTLLAFSDNGTPRSAGFDDVYHSESGGIPEKRHVFIQASGFADHDGKSPCTILETGFGTGLNFLLAWQHWRQQKPAHPLHYVSIEGFPLTASQFGSIAIEDSELAGLRRQLTAKYPSPEPGMHRIWLQHNQVCLTLVYDQAASALQNLDMAADYVFLDGFSPAKNPEMWSKEVIQGIAACCKPGARFSTYTVAAKVRLALEAAGFSFAKVPGSGDKREILAGHYAPDTHSPTEPWFARPKSSACASIGIIGSGIAGASLAWAFSRRGLQPQVFETTTEIAAGASGGPQVSIAPYLSTTPSTASLISLAAFRYLQQLLSELALEPVAQGALSCDQTKRTEAQLEQLLAAHQLSAESAEIRYNNGIAQLFFPTARVLEPQPFCARLLENATIMANTNIATVKQTECGWQLYDAEAKLLSTVDTLFIAAGINSIQFQACGQLPLNVRRGQLSVIPVTEASRGLRHALLGDAMVLPCHQQSHVIGATFDHLKPELWHQPAPVRISDHKRNLDKVCQVYPDLFASKSQDEISQVSGWAANRVVSPDHLPLAGAVPDWTRYRQDYQGLYHGPRYRRFPLAEYLPGLYVLTGLGARGFNTAPIMAELCAAYCLEEPLPIARPLAEAVHPGRFEIRALKRQQTNAKQDQ